MEIKQGGVVSRLLADVPIPRMFRAEQLFPRERIAPQTSPPPWRELSRSPSAQNPARHVHRHHGGQPGIANVDLITRSIADFVKARGAVPSSCPPWAATAAPLPRAVGGAGQLRHHPGGHGL
ncbi:MAG: hypothetical protein ACLRIS_04965 [Flavonifractor plautii]